MPSNQIIAPTGAQSAPQYQQNNSISYGSGGASSIGGSALSGAAAGAALGSVVPGVGTAIGAGVGLVTGLMSGIFGHKSQKAANKANLQIARETNASNERIAQQSNALTYKMQQEQMKYASPAEQRRMLEEAGYNPYLYAQQSAHPASGSSATPGNAQIAPSMMAENGMATALGGMSGDMAQLVGTLADARKKESETRQIELQNQVFLEKFKQDMRLLGEESKALEIENQYRDSKQVLSLDALKKANVLTDRQITNLELVNKINEFTHDKLLPEQVANIMSSTRLNTELGATQINLRKFYDACSSANLTNAETNRLLAELQKWLTENYIAPNIQQNTAYTGSLTSGQNEANSLVRVYGSAFADAQLEKMNGDSQVAREMRRKVYNESRKLQQDIDWRVFDKVLEAGLPIAILKGVFGNIGSAPVAAPPGTYQMPTFTY